MTAQNTPALGKGADMDSRSKFEQWFHQARIKEPFYSRGISPEDIWKAGRESMREEAFKKCEAREEEYLKRERWRFPELRTDAAHGCGECALDVASIEP